MLYVPRQGLATIEGNAGTTSAEFGTTLTASGSIHTKGSYSTLIAATAYDSFGISIFLAGTGTVASTNERCLADIAIGAAASEVDIISNLMCGNTPQWGSAHNYCASYYFPIFIPAGVRLSGRCQALIASDTVTCYIVLHQHPMAAQWYGSRVTTYGANTGTSSGVSHTSGSTNSYATATQIISSTTNPIKYLQLGMDLGTDTTGASMRGQVRLGYGATPDYFVSDLPWAESTTLETVNFSYANVILSRMGFNIPAAADLRLSARVSGTGEARGWVLYGVD